MSSSTTTVCSPPPPASYSSACSRCFPAVTALVSSYGLFADPSTIGANLQTLALMLPEGSFQIVQDQIARVLDKGSTALGWTFLFGLAPCDLERQCRRQGRDRRAQRGL